MVDEGIIGGRLQSDLIKFQGYLANNKMMLTRNQSRAVLNLGHKATWQLWKKMWQPKLKSRRDKESGLMTWCESTVFCILRQAFVTGIRIRSLKIAIMNELARLQKSPKPTRKV